MTEVLPLIAEQNASIEVQAAQAVADAERITREAANVAQDMQPSTSTETGSSSSNEESKGFTVVDKRSTTSNERVGTNLNGLVIRDYEPKHDVLAVAHPTNLTETSASSSRHAAPEDNQGGEVDSVTGEVSGKHRAADTEFAGGKHRLDDIDSRRPEGYDQSLWSVLDEQGKKEILVIDAKIQTAKAEAAREAAAKEAVVANTSEPTEPIEPTSQVANSEKAVPMTRRQRVARKISSIFRRNNVAVLETEAVIEPIAAVEASTPVEATSTETTGATTETESSIDGLFAGKDVNGDPVTDTVTENTPDEIISQDTKDAYSAQDQKPELELPAADPNTDIALTAAHQAELQRQLAEATAAEAELPKVA